VLGYLRRVRLKTHRTARIPDFCLHRLGWPPGRCFQVLIKPALIEVLPNRVYGGFVRSISVPGSRARRRGSTAHCGPLEG